MATKAAQAKQEKTALRYVPDDLVARDPVADDAAMDSYLQRNRDPLNASIAKARAEFERGEYFTLDEVVADVDAQRQRRRIDKA